MEIDGIQWIPYLIIDSVLKNGKDSPVARIARVAVPGVYDVGRSLTPKVPLK